VLPRQHCAIGALAFGQAGEHVLVLLRGEGESSGDVLVDETVRAQRVQQTQAAVVPDARPQRVAVGQAVVVGPAGLKVADEEELAPALHQQPADGWSTGK
jgi:hypothetical protein